MPTTSPNMDPLPGIPSMPCEGGHLVLTLQASPHLATFFGPSLGASNGAQTTSPNTIQTEDVHKALSFQKNIGS
jgi:hypothetical protein